MCIYYCFDLCKFILMSVFWKYLWNICTFDAITKLRQSCVDDIANIRSHISDSPYILRLEQLYVKNEWQKLYPVA